MPLENLRVGLTNLIKRPRVAVEGLVEKIRKQEFRVPQIRLPSPQQFIENRKETTLLGRTFETLRKPERLETELQKVETRIGSIRGIGGEPSLLPKTIAKIPRVALSFVDLDPAGQIKTQKTEELLKRLGTERNLDRIGVESALFGTSDKRLKENLSNEDYKLLIDYKQRQFFSFGFATTRPISKEIAKFPQFPQVKIDPVQKIISAIKEARPIRRAQEKLYTAERATRFPKAEEIGLRVGGEKGFFAEKASLKGELPKVQFESLRDSLQQTDIDSLFNTIRQHPTLMYGERLTAQEGLSNLLGVKGAGVPTKSELRVLNQVFGNEFTSTVLAKRPLFTRLWETVGDVLSIPRSLMAGALDMSFGLRQGVFNAYRYPKQWASAFKNQFKYFASEDAFQALNKEIQSRPNYNLMKKNKLALMDLGQTLSKREEQFQSTLAEKIPVIGKIVRATSRAYTGFANKFRADIFDDFVKLGERTGAIEDSTFLKSAANFVNNSTGRGSLGQLESSIGVLSTTLFSPRLLASRINLLNPVYYARLNPTVRKRALGSVLAFLGGTATVLSLAELGGAKVGKDPTSSDFGKIKVGNTRIDLLGGFQQPIVLLSRLFTGRVKSSITGEETLLGEGYRPLTRFDVVLRYFEGKEAPIVSFFTFLFKSQNWVGKPFVFSEKSLRGITPIFIQDLVDLYREGGEEKAFPIGLGLAFFGAGVQTYAPSEKQQRRISAKELYVNLPKLPPEQASAMLQQAIRQDPGVIDELKRVAKEAPLSREDRKILLKPVNATYSPELWERATYIVKKLGKMEEKEKAQYIGELVRKKVITEDVANQINVLLLQQKNAPEQPKKKLQVNLPKINLSGLARLNPFNPPEVAAAEIETPITPLGTEPITNESIKQKAKGGLKEFLQGINIFKPKEVLAPSATDYYEKNPPKPYALGKGENGKTRFFYPNGGYSDIDEKDIPKYGALLQKNYKQMTGEDWPNHAPNWLSNGIPSTKTKEATKATITPYNKAIQNTFADDWVNATRVLRYVDEAGNLGGENRDFVTGPEGDWTGPETGITDRGLFRIASSTFEDFMQRKSQLLKKYGITKFEDMWDVEKNIRMAKIIFDEQGWDAWEAAPLELISAKEKQRRKKRDLAKK